MNQFINEKGKHNRRIVRHLQTVVSGNKTPSVALTQNHEIVFISIMVFINAWLLYYC